MRLQIEFTSDKSISLSNSYNRALQGMIYSLLYNSNTFLHETGYPLGKRRFKLFTYSRLFGKFNSRGSYIEFDKDISLLISSPIKEFIEEISTSLINNEFIELEINRLKVNSIKFLSKPAIEDSNITIYTLSPITVYSTLYTKDQRKKTYYYSPYEEEFSELISANLIKKYRLLTNMVIDGKVVIKPLKKIREIVTSFKGTIIKGYAGYFTLQGNPELIKVGYECGLGSKNSAGFGMIEVARNA